MNPDTKPKVWIRFESKRKDGSVVKLRIQDLPKNRMEDYKTFLLTYLIRDEAFYKATGIYKNEKAIEEYKMITNKLYELRPPEVAICCLDTESEEFDEILAASIVQKVSNEISVGDTFGEIKKNLKNKEMHAFINSVGVISGLFPESVKETYEHYYEGRGIIVRPDYRGLRIASEIVKQRRLLCQEKKVPMTCAWMTSIGSQKAAERDGWETIAEVAVDELNKLTGLIYETEVQSFKLMIATPNI